MEFIEFTPSSPMSLQSHFNPREGPPHPPSPLQFPGMSSALALTPPHHSKYFIVFRYSWPFILLITVNKLISIILFIGKKK